MRHGHQANWQSREKSEFSLSATFNSEPNASVPQTVAMTAPGPPCTSVGNVARHPLDIRSTSARHPLDIQWQRVPAVGTRRSDRGFLALARADPGDSLVCTGPAQHGIELTVCETFERFPRSRATRRDAKQNAAQKGFVWTKGSAKLLKQVRRARSVLNETASL